MPDDQDPAGPHSPGAGSDRGATGKRPGLLGSFGGLGFEFAAGVAGTTLIGLWIDRHYDSQPWGTLVGAVIGLVGGMYNMIRAALAQGRREPPS